MNDHSGALWFVDRVYCLTLPQCVRRQQSAVRQLATLGINEFSFFTATNGSDPAVKELFESSRVADFPPCFRCGMKSCGSNSCNNFLTPEQVATFVSYTRLWQRIIDENTPVALIVEDDVVFTDYAAEVLREAFLEGSKEKFGLNAESESLLRLGWAFCDDHAATENPRIVPGLVEMSNPCHLVTLGMAKRLLRDFSTVSTTVDNYTHYVVGHQVNNLTLMPPIAYDLSWSTGAVDSMIHPNPSRIRYLEQQGPGKEKALERAKRKIELHFNHKLVRKILCVGHPRCGSGYISELLRALHLDVGHEFMGEDGISSWMFAVTADRNPYFLNKYAASRKYTVFDHVIHHVRNPADAIPSIIRENRHSERSYRFRQLHISERHNVDIDAFSSELDGAIASYLYWNRIIEDSNPDLVVRIEDSVADIEAFLKQHQLLDHVPERHRLPGTSVNSEKQYAGVSYEKPALTASDWSLASPSLIKELDDFCDRYGYPGVARETEPRA